MKTITQLALSATLLAVSLSQFAWATAVDYSPYCPSIKEIHAMPFMPNQSYYLVGTNAQGVNFKANTDLPQYIFTKGRTPELNGLSATLTHFTAKTQTLNCTYDLTNRMGYEIPYPIYNHGAYQECPNGQLVLTGQTC